MITLRKCNYNDLDKIFKWINDTEVRKNSFNSSYISRIYYFFYNKNISLK